MEYVKEICWFGNDRVILKTLDGTSKTINFKNISKIELSKLQLTSGPNCEMTGEFIPVMKVYPTHSIVDGFNECRRLYEAN